MRTDEELEGIADAAFMADAPCGEIRQERERRALYNAALDDALAAVDREARAAQERSVAFDGPCSVDHVFIDGLLAARAAIAKLRGPK